MKAIRNKHMLWAMGAAAAVTGIASTALALTAMTYTTACPTTTPGTCYATFTGGLLTTPLSIPFAGFPTDASAGLVPIIGGTAVDLLDGFQTYVGACMGGATGSEADVSASLLAGSVLAPAAFNIPAGGAPSPLFGALPFTQKLLLFEEFGPETLAASTNTAQLPLPAASGNPADPELSTSTTRSQPKGADLENFLGWPGLYPFPTRLANTSLPNPWWSAICPYLGRSDCSKAGPVEGRPNGEGWAHQRWDEFTPAKMLKTAITGARANLGFRNVRQRHGYTVGEFGPTGLNYKTTNAATSGGSTAGIKIQFHPNMPVQNHESVWTFDGTLPPKLLQVRYGESVLMRNYNALPIDVSANRGFGLHTITTHEHNGHNPAESDGFAGAFFFPGQFYDYRWPLALAGHDTINLDATDPRAGTPCVKGETMRVPRRNGPQLVTCDVSRDPKGLNGSINLRGDYRETMSAHWFHDHMEDFTSQNVYKGNAAAMNYYSAIDRGNESVADGVNLRFPSGSGLSWGNRDYDVNLVLGDKAFDKDGQLWFNPFQTNGFLGDVMTVNFAYKPTLDVRARRYRFRVLDGAVARYFKIAVVRQIAGTTGTLKGPTGSKVSYEAVPFYMIANDGNIMEHAVAFDGTNGTEKGVLPVQGIGERYDIVVDFAANGVKAGDKLFFVNMVEHKDGHQPNQFISLVNILNGSYQPAVSGNQWINGDPAVGTFMQLNVVACKDATGKAVTCTDPSMNPALYLPGNTNGPSKTALKMLPRPVFSATDLATAKRHTFDLGKSGNATDSKPWNIKVDGASQHTADTRRVSVAPNLADVSTSGAPHTEVWTLSSGGGWSHPLHIHFEEGQILTKDGKAPPIWEAWARKDMFRLGGEAGSASKIEVAFHFREFSGTYVEHCHNTTHEDHAMLIRWDIERPGQTVLMPAPVPTWDGVGYVTSVAESKFRTGL